MDDASVLSVGGHKMFSPLVVINRTVITSSIGWFDLITIRR